MTTSAHRRKTPPHRRAYTADKGRAAVTAFTRHHARPASYKYILQHSVPQAFAAAQHAVSSRYSVPWGRTVTLTGLERLSSLLNAHALDLINLGVFEVAFLA